MLDGIAYRAPRIYRRVGPIPVQIVRCDVLHPEQLAPVEKDWKETCMALFHNCWWVLLIVILFQDWGFRNRNCIERAFSCGRGPFHISGIFSHRWSHTLPGRGADGA